MGAKLEHVDRRLFDCAFWCARPVDGHEGGIAVHFERLAEVAVLDTVYSTDMDGSSNGSTYTLPLQV